MDLLLKDSGWSIVSSWGVTATVGVPVVQLQIGAGRLVMPVEHKATKEQQLLEGTGPGVSVGLSPEIVFWTDIANVSGSTEEVPSVGSQIFCRKGMEKISVNDLEGTVTVVSGSGTLGFGSAGGGMVLWLRQPAACKEWKCKVARAAKSAVLLNGTAELIMQTYAVGFLAGLALDSDLIAAGISNFTYLLKAAPKA